MAGVFAVVKRRVTILVRAVEQTPGRLAKLMHGSVVEKDVSDGDDIFTGREHGECCVKIQ